MRAARRRDSLRCLYIGQDCRKKWKLIKTIFGYCLQFIPWSPPNSRETIGRQYYVTITFETDQTDLLGGWRAFMEGATVYYSSVHEQTQDACYSLNVNTHLVPIISIRRTTRFMLGEPYSTCIKHQHTQNLENTSFYFESYTKPQCLIAWLQIILRQSRE
ncbi:Oidioi.mRNA.OKI2018_I69.XSR.g15110.t1.cds [Oikopleura dioica]|uniref:Oidioi.mRNA.OKI2018_I69.XSR.g15110.t1.cds n=1 Tax=Oikopleura dioica TaxID=34765 RepID=A0ABN7SFT1_OIKDI|nr:Oidioi.mRNA.OKI2018_I69.XSR.g15110.t1.cds [Oikopleura dioica]